MYTHRLLDTSARRAADRGLIMAPAFLSYGQIARTLTQRHGAPVGAALLKRLCHRAEGKLTAAMRANPDGAEPPASPPHPRIPHAHERRSSP